MSIKIYEIESFKDLNLFWNMFHDYINYIFETSPLSKETFEYFYPLKIIFFKEKDKILGFATYIIYIDEKGKSIILEYCINKEFRNKGLGKIAYSKLQERMIKEGAKTIELTPTNKRNELFWKNNGFSDTMIFCQDGRHLLIKKLNS